MDALGERILAAEEIVEDMLESLWARIDRWTRGIPHFWKCIEWIMLVYAACNALSYICAEVGIFVEFLIKDADVKHPQPPQVLIWWAHTLPWTFATLSNGDGILTSACPPFGANLCHVTADRGAINTSDAIVFGAESFNLADLPPHRRRSQAWVFFAKGPPQFPPSRDLLEMAPFFNWTMSFREDADIIVPYKTWSPAFDMPNVSKLAASTIQKTRTAVWMISDCEKQKLGITGNFSRGSSPWSGTERFINAVLDQLDVAVISDCGRPLCASTHECLSLLQDEYDFVFVMESSPCFEHPAQFIYDSFYYDIIPVFFGVGNFKHPLPPHTFIDTSKLGDARDAVDVLTKIGASRQAYANFLMQRQSFVLIPAADNMCALCSALYAPPNKPLHKDSLMWWGSRSDCSKYTETQWSGANVSQSADARNRAHLQNGTGSFARKYF